MGFKFNPFTGNLDLAGGSNPPSNSVTSASVPSTAQAIARFVDTSGTSIEDSLASVDDLGNIVAVNLSGTNTGDVTLTAVGAVPNADGASLSGQALTLQPADATHPGVLTSADWNAFNGKQDAGSYITDITGDGTASGPGSVGFTLATVNASPGSFGDASHSLAATVNAKGLVTNLSANAIQIAESQVTSLVSNLAATEKTANKGAANGYASLDSNSLIPVTQIPPAVLERLVIVADQTARFALTTATVQNGDTVKQTDTETMYFVIDDTNLGNSSGYSVYSAGTAVNFSGSLTGDVGGTQGATLLATVNASPGSFGDASHSLSATVNAKGLITALSANSIQIAESQVTNLVSDLAGKQASGNYAVASAGDINETSFTAADNQSSAANVTGLAFANATVRSADILLSIVRSSTYAQYKIHLVQGASSWYMDQSYLGDDAGLVFSVTTAGQVKYTSTSTGSTAAIRFRAITTSV